MKKPYINVCEKCRKITALKSKLSRYICNKCRKEKGLYARDFQILSKAIMARDGNKCLCCLRNKNLLVHHIDRNKMNNKPDNLITLCTQCHMSMHQFYKNKPKKFTRMMRIKKFPLVDYQKFGVRLLYN